MKRGVDHSPANKTVNAQHLQRKGDVWNCRALHHARFFLVVLSTWSCLPGLATGAEYGGGTGDASNPYLVYTAEHMNTIGTHPDDWDRHFKLMADIDLHDLPQSQFHAIGYPGLYSPLGVTIDSDTQKIYWTEAGMGKIQRANLDGTEVEDVINDLRTPFGIALDPVGRKLYWTDLGNDRIQRANVDGSEIEDLVTGDVGTPRGIAVGGSRLFWADSGQRCLATANLDGSGMETIVNSGLDRPMGIAVDLDAGHLYWADADTGKIQRANLDGTHVVDLVSGVLDRPTGIALDAVNRRIYWSDWGSDKIQSAAWDGSDVRDMVSNGLMTPYLMAVDNEHGYVYWADRDMVKIQRLETAGSQLDDVVIQNPPFGGVLDGNGKAILNYRFSCTGLSKIGLLGHVRGDTAQVRDLRLVGPILHATGTGSIGILVGQLDRGSIVNCHIANAALAGSGHAGGLVGSNHGSVIGCSVEISGNGASGLVARNSGIISDCRVYGDIVRGSGLAGSNEGQIEYCDAYVQVENGCGLVGTNKGIITCSYMEGHINGRSNLGGLIGTNKGTLTFSYAHATIAATGKAIGGAVGTNESMISHCYTWGDVSGREYVGGLVGLNQGRILQCYTVCAVSGEVETGGIAGDGNDISESFWDMDATGQAISAGGHGHRTAEMQSKGIYAAAGWDFVGGEDGPSDIWVLSASGGYPTFWWQLAVLPELPSFAGGRGSWEDPYLIAKAEHLNSIGCNPRLMDGKYVLMGDIDLSDTQFHTIGSDAMPFSGHFGGNGHCIANLSLKNTKRHHVGLFGALAGSDAQITDLCLINPEVVAEHGYAVGALAGEVFYGTILNCTVKEGVVCSKDEVGGLIGRSRNAGILNSHYSGSVDGGIHVGGLIGQMELGMIHGSTSNCSVWGQETVGGFVGENLGGEVQECYTTGWTRGAAVLGGLIGENDGRVEKCHAENNVTDATSAGRDIGGLIGLNGIAGQVTDSFFRGTVVGSQYVGGLAGENGGNITRCYAVVDVVGQERVGGLVGWNFAGILSRCFSKGNIAGGSRVGGLVGDNSGMCFHVCSAGGVILDCYSNAMVSGNDTVGGLAGSNGGYRIDDEGTVLQCYASGLIDRPTGTNVGGLIGLGRLQAPFGI